MTNPSFRHFFCLFGMLPLLAHSASYARNNSLSVGLSSSIDYEKSQFQEEEEFISPIGRTERDDEYAALVFTPSLTLRSEAPGDVFELRFAPSANYDMVSEETDWNLHASVSSELSLSRMFKLSLSDELIRSDSYNDRTFFSDGNTTRELSVSDRDPELAADRGRSRYWLNIAEITTDYQYDQGGVFSLGFEHRRLRNDGIDVNAYEDYDRKQFMIREEHRFSPVWRATAEIFLIDGDFSGDDEANNSEVGFPENIGSPDVREYHLSTTIENNFWRQNQFSLVYNYIGTQYDAAVFGDGEIHELQLRWQREFSNHLTTTLGAGPSYEKTEGQEENIGGNGLASLNYTFRQWTISAIIEKNFEVDNFSGNGERGFIDLWRSEIAATYRLDERISLNARVGYRHEDREITLARTIADDTTQSNSTITEQTLAGCGVRYIINRNYSVAMDYSYIQEDAEQVGGDYDEHRLLFTLTWQQEWFRW